MERNVYKPFASIEDILATNQDENGKFKADNVNVHRAAAKVIVSKSRAARGSVCNVLLFRDYG